jgi:hypothetical protein
MTMHSQSVAFLKEMIFDPVAERVKDRRDFSVEHRKVSPFGD